ncbi:MAG: hypothetical protein ACYC6Y_31825 [Thermoguttaceae bacterium]
MGAVRSAVVLWYSKRVDVYVAAAEADRPQCLDQTIAEVEQWRALAALLPTQDPGQDSGRSETRLLQIFRQQVEAWKQGASPQRRKEITQFDAALRARWVLHVLASAIYGQGRGTAVSASAQSPTIDN